MNNFDKIKALDIDEMAKLIVMIEHFFDVAGVNEDGVREWLESEVRE